MVVDLGTFRGRYLGRLFDCDRTRCGRVDWDSQFIKERRGVGGERQRDRQPPKKINSRVLGLGLILNTGSGSPYGGRPVCMCI